ncbi:MAG: hypothetical protein IPG32_17735 [Saprospirales bacterium]|nr:hypothetical protein [Saprospirales bacterium]
MIRPITRLGSPPTMVTKLVPFLFFLNKFVKNRLLVRRFVPVHALLEIIATRTAQIAHVGDIQGDGTQGARCPDGVPEAGEEGSWR